MDNNKATWVEERLAALEPPREWAPDPVAARVRLRSRDEKVRRRTWTWAAVTAVLAVGILALPAPRALAERLWQQLSLRHVEVLRVNFDDLPEGLTSLRAWSSNDPVTQVVASSREEARDRAGYDPRLPAEAAGVPTLTVVSSMSAALTMHTGELRQALAQAGVSDIRIPDDWDGARVRVRVSPMVIAAYGGLSLVQITPPTLETPPGFDTSKLLEAALRILRTSPADAKAWAQRFAAAPGLLLAVPREEAGLVETVELRAGRGLLIEDRDKRKARERLTVVWNSTDRIYALSGDGSRERLIAIANSVR